ncbi:MAG: DNA primase, partial [Chloroflexi bacterium]|nr:DNA primase [Chloroflexota bacterium]
MAIIDEVKQKADIVDIISQYGVRLDKMGKNLKAQCPFHSEKHASFFVFPEQQRWHCFGACATGGDVFAFVMRKEGADFGHALRILADKVGVRLTEASKAEDSERDRLYELNALAAEHYHHLLTGTAAGDMARSYLEKRGITSWGISAFQLGFSLDSWDGLAKHAMAKGFTEKALLASGLAVEREGGGSYDRFRGRLMFPIRDGQGRVTGFGGRSLDGSDPKYMNSPQTLVFDKSGTLYG